MVNIGEKNQRNQRDHAMTDRGLRDLAPLTCGSQHCEGGYSFGPSIRHYYLLHYVVSGSGVLHTGEGDYPVSAGQYFLILPGEITVYTADEKTPWTYVWITFVGEETKRLSAVPRVGKLSPALMGELFAASENDFADWGGVAEEYVTAVLHRILAELLAHRQGHEHYARRAASYIRTMYMEDITVESIAAMLSLDRRYLSRLFRARYGVTMQEYLISVRLENGAAFLRQGHSVTESARMCGYPDNAGFSKMFRRRYGVSPGTYAAQNR